MQSEWPNLVTLPRATLAIDPTLRRRHATSLGLFLAILRIDAPGLTTRTSVMKPVDPIRRLVFLKCHSVADLQAADPFTGVSGPLAQRVDPRIDSAHAVDRDGHTLAKAEAHAPPTAKGRPSSASGRT